MTKIMLVEDDNNLREIYEARLQAEGFDIVSAPDGEAALALAAKERPDLIITDVMMPKISGFEMLDIMRNTENLRDVKVIMLTALGQAEDNARAGALGADRYLVKSQVTLEDIVKATHDVLEPASQALDAPASDIFVADTPTPAAPTTVAPVVDSTPPTDSTPVVDAPVEAAAPVEAVEPVAAPVAEPAEQTPPVEAAAPSQPPEPAVADDSQPTAAPSISIPVSDDQPQDAPQAASDDQPADQPEGDQPTPDLSSLAQLTDDDSSTTAQEESVMHDQINQFLGDVDNQAPQPPAEQTDAEMQADAAVPDRGELSIQPVVAEAEPAAEPESAVESEPATEPELASEPQSASEPQPVVQPEPSQTPGDQAMSEAITNMMAGSPAAQAYQQEAAPTVILPEPVVMPAAEPSLQPQTPQFNTEPAPSKSPETSSESQPAAEPDPNAPAPIAHKRVIVPLGTSSKPDINQLLAMEEAKTAANQVATQIPITEQPLADFDPAMLSGGQPQQVGQPEPQPQPGNWQPSPPPAQPPVMPLQPAPGEQPAQAQPWRMPGQQTQGPTHNYGGSDVDPNSISL